MFQGTCCHPARVKTELLQSHAGNRNRSMRMPSLIARIILLTSLLLGAETALADFGSCADAEYMHVFDVRLGASECDVVGVTTITARGRTTQLRVLKLRGSVLGDSEALMARFRELARSVGAAMEQMGNVSVGDVSVLLTDSRPPDGSYAHTWTLDAARDELRPLRRRNMERECQMAFFKGDNHTEESYFYLAYAHEIFHCMQYLLWPRQMGAGDAGSWWIEGTADYFALLARPGATRLDPHFLRFDTKSVNTALYDMSYETAVFFAWWGQTRGHNAIPAFMDQMPSRADQTQLEALQHVVTSDTWSEFSRAYLDKNIRLPGGRTIPSNPVQGETLRISDAGVFRLPAHSYVVARRPITFAPGRAYHLSFEGRPADARIKWAESPGTGWSEPPSTVSACESEAKFREVRGTTSSDTAGTLRVSVLDRNTHCNCLVGDWWMTEASLLADLRRHADRKVESQTIVSGGLRLSFNPDATPTSNGTGHYVHDHLVYRSQYRPGSGPNFVETTLDDSSPIFWNTGMGSLMIAFQHPFRREGTVHTETHMRKRHYPNSRGEDGVSQPITKSGPLLLAEVGVGPLLGGSTYECRANSLHIESALHPDGTHYFDFIRAPVPTR
jgi:hypothetical protein